ncbi:MAG: restriction endonuclease subunit S [Cohaesibacter sp.]|jgi:type I restriction enzyme S subunit|nr:restriction endonuclease subunit S [Cohaesibacter sp.]
MKTLLKKRSELQKTGRWDIDFHLPPEEIVKYRDDLINRVDAVASVQKSKRDPTKTPDTTFQYIDISSVDVANGVIANPQEVAGVEAPSRARKVVRAFDIIISTCRPTRGAIAVVPIHLHNQIASTGFSVIRANANVNPYYLHFALRQPSTLEQFRKWSTGSSYPAILDEDVEKTRVPIPSREEQDAIAREVVQALLDRQSAVKQADAMYGTTLKDIRQKMYKPGIENGTSEVDDSGSADWPCTIDEIESALSDLPELDIDQLKRVKMRRSI